MRKIINDPRNFVEETMEGITLAYGGKVALLNGDPRVLVRATPKEEGKVAVVTGGGSGHLPVFLGYVGEGMLDGCAVGNVFASPSAQKMTDMILGCDRGAGVLCLYGNYGGDSLNFGMARENADFEDVKTAEVRFADDVASAPKGEEARRRGVAGVVFAFKVAGAAAEQGKSLEEVTTVAEKALANIRTMGVALSPCIIPEVGKPSFSIEEDEIEIGMGIHGEPGIEVRKMMTADEIAEVILGKILEDMPLSEGDEVSVLVNGLGGTPMEELLIVYRRVHQILAQKGVKIHMPHIGEYATSMEMAGLSVSLFRLDAEMKALLESPAGTPFYTNANK
ncbi:MAG: dihydroxyacetone kinase subunit DhaK [Christensenellaceae bacterium]|jgi:dihydroxyacetone kinase-like protein|nr:dihydroxyacetone kinase subunit DhaK [Christensenellaceae bacterium]